MSDDVRQLFDVFGVPGFPYREIRLEERTRRAGLLDLWGPGSLEPRPAGGGDGRDVAIVSLQEGAGRTTVAANLSRALSRAGRSCVAVDCDPKNALARHFSASGRGSVAPREVLVLAAGSDDGAGAGSIAPGPGWLRSRLAASPPGGSAAVLDTPAAESFWLRLALAAADDVIAVLRPGEGVTDAARCTAELVAEHGRAPIVVLNQFDAGRAGDRELWFQLRAAWRGTAPLPVHFDPVVPEAGAAGRSLLDEAADSQVVLDFARLAELVLARERRVRAKGG